MLRGGLLSRVLGSEVLKDAQWLYPGYGSKVRGSWELCAEGCQMVRCSGVVS